MENFCTKYKEKKYSEYLYVFGDGANVQYYNIANILYNFPNIFSNIVALEYVDGIRWNLLLKGNVTIKLPQYNVKEALNLYVKNIPEISCEKASAVIDLRAIPDKIFIKTF